MFSVAPNILLAPNMTQNAERKHRTQDANTAHNRLRILALAYPSGQTANAFPILVTPSLSFLRPLLPLDTWVIRPRVYCSLLILHLLNVFT